MSKNNKISQNTSGPGISDFSSDLAGEKSELNADALRKRLEPIIGNEKPFAWAKRLGLSSATFSRMWNDNVAPKSDTLLIISAATGLSIDWLLTGEGPMRRGEAVLEVEPEENKEVDIAGDIDPADGDVDLTRGFGLLAKIYSSRNKVLIRAIIANLLAFSEAIDNKQRAINSERRMAQLEERLAILEKTLRQKPRKAANG